MKDMNKSYIMWKSAISEKISTHFAVIQGWENSQCFHSMQATASGIEPYSIQVLKSKKLKNIIPYRTTFWIQIKIHFMH